MNTVKKMDKGITIGIPKALLYFKYAQLWESFFHTLGVDYIVSPDTTRDTIAAGMNVAVDETCLSSKIYLGHVTWLMDKCDMILVPRISNFGKAGTVCTKHQAIYDVVKATFRDTGLKLLHYNIDLNNSEKEMRAFIQMGTQLGKRKAHSIYAYWSAKQSQKTEAAVAQAQQQRLLETDGMKILIIAHRYNVFDQYIGAPIIRMLKQMGVTPINGCVVDEKTAILKSTELSDTLPWYFNKELVGAIAEYKDDVDGIILMSSFPCGPDSMVNEIIIRRVKDKPILNLILDGQEGGAGLETRLESFVDIIQFRRNERHG